MVEEDRRLVQEMFAAIEDLSDMRQIAICKGLYALCVQQFKQANGVLPEPMEQYMDKRGWELALSSRRELSDMTHRPSWLTFGDVTWQGELKNEVACLVAFMYLKGSSPFLHKATTKISKATLINRSTVSAFLGQLEARGFIKKMNQHDYGVVYREA